MVELLGKRPRWPTPPSALPELPRGPASFDLCPNLRAWPPQFGRSRTVAPLAPWRSSDLGGGEVNPALPGSGAGAREDGATGRRRAPLLAAGPPVHRLGKLRRCLALPQSTATSGTAATTTLVSRACALTLTSTPCHAAHRAAVRARTPEGTAAWLSGSKPWMGKLEPRRNCGRHVRARRRRGQDLPHLLALVETGAMEPDDPGLEKMHELVLDSRRPSWSP